MTMTEAFREDNIGLACEKCGIEGPMREAVLEAAREINASAEQTREAREYYDLLFLSGKDQVAAAAQWPNAPRDSSLGARLKYAVVCLAGLPEIRKAHAARRIPEEITWHTMSDLSIWMSNNRKIAGDWAFEKIDWLARHCQSRLFRLGRLQVEIATFEPPAVVFRHSVKPLKQVEPLKPLKALKEWIVALQNGRVVDPCGRILEGEYRFDPPGWSIVLKQGDAVAVAHLPGGTGLRGSDLQDFGKAVPEFLRSHFPELNITAIYIEGWIIDPALESFLPERTRIVGMIRDVYHLKREKGSARPMLRSLFGKRVENVDEVVPETSMQRAIVDAIRSGVQFRGGSAFTLLGLPIGEQIYRKSFREWQDEYAG